MDTHFEIKTVSPRLNNGVLILTDPDRPSISYSFSTKAKVESGSFGSVLVNDDGYALKIYKPEDLSLKLFEREVNALNAVKSLPNFISIHMYGVIEDRDILGALGYPGCEKAHFIIMDRVHNKLDEWIKTLKTEEDVRILFRQICDRVLRLNTIGFIHRDLKPDNIMYDVDEIRGERVVKLVGFTLTKQGDYSVIQGTRYYMAPEVFVLTEPAPCPLADIWSLGATLLEILIKMSGGKISKCIPRDFYKRAPAFIDDIKCIQWDEFPNCRALLYRLLTPEGSRITVEELKAYEWLDLNP